MTISLTILGRPITGGTHAPHENRPPDTERRILPVRDGRAMANPGNRQARHRPALQRLLGVLHADARDR